METFSVYSGSYFSRELGASIDGGENNFKFNLPDILIVACKDSEPFKSVLLVVSSISKSPTAPLKLDGALSGSLPTWITLLPAVIFF